jgi:hypothetical protein
MTFTFKLEQADGTPADPPTFRASVPNWRPSDTIPLGRKALRAVGVRRARTRTEIPYWSSKTLARRVTSDLTGSFVGSNGGLARSKRVAFDCPGPIPGRGKHILCAV